MIEKTLENCSKISSWQTIKYVLSLHHVCASEVIRPRKIGQNKIRSLLRCHSNNVPCFLSPNVVYSRLNSFVGNIQISYKKYLCVLVYYVAWTMNRYFKLYLKFEFQSSTSSHNGWYLSSHLLLATTYDNMNLSFFKSCW